MRKLLLLLVLAAPLSAQDGKFVGVASCANAGCHGATAPLNATRILQNEYYTWLNNDRHAHAYNVLFNERSARIAKNMRLRRKAYEESACLDCHSTYVLPTMVSGRIDPEDGVQCEACHGPAGGWRNEHAQPGWTHEQSVAHGMTDLRDTRNRSHTCNGCHLGNPTKQVDHELIASGHPILAFELDNYSETMPPHWVRNKPTHGAAAWAVGQAMSLRDSLALLAGHARSDRWPEFSDMSCFNCHHSLETSGWRQQRGWNGRAGLPAWSPQHWTVLRLIVNRAAPAARAELDDAVQQIAARVARMNDGDGVATAAESAKRIVEGALPSIAKLTWRDSDVREVMRAIAGDEEFILRSDVHSAEQVALSLQSLSAALTRSNPKLLKSAMTDAVDALFAEVQNREKYEPARFVEKLRALRAAI
jgi:hypothetical protein